ncbi:unnamed protein product [Caretta caretta]
MHTRRLHPFCTPQGESTRPGAPEIAMGWGSIRKINPWPCGHGPPALHSLGGGCQILAAAVGPSRRPHLAYCAQNLPESDGAGFREEPGGKPVSHLGRNAALV